MNMEEAIMEIIMGGGDCKSWAMEAIVLAEEGKFEKADQALKKANQALSKAHEMQTELMRREINDEKIPLSILMIHAQDHLMNGITVKDLAGTIVRLHKRVNDFIGKRGC